MDGVEREEKFFNLKIKTAHTSSRHRNLNFTSSAPPTPLETGEVFVMKNPQPPLRPDNDCDAIIFPIYLENCFRRCLSAVFLVSSSSECKSQATGIARSLALMTFCVRSIWQANNYNN